MVLKLLLTTKNCLQSEPICHLYFWGGKLREKACFTDEEAVERNVQMLTPQPGWLFAESLSYSDLVFVLLFTPCCLWRLTFFSLLCANEFSLSPDATVHLRECVRRRLYMCFSSYASNRLLCLQREMIWHSNSAPPSLALSRSRFLLYQCLPRFCDSSEKPSQTQFSHSSSCHYHILITFFKEGPGVK